MPLQTSKESPGLLLMEGVGRAAESAGADRERRGAYPTAYGPGTTLREKLFSTGPYLPASHPAAQYRDIEAFKRRQAEHGAAIGDKGKLVQEVTA